MSKKKKKKFKPSYVPQRTGGQKIETVNPVMTAVATSPAPVSKPTSSAVMTFSDSRQAIANHAAYNSHQAEYSNINKDLIKVVIVNGLLFAAILVVYFLNNSNPFLDDLYNRIF
jgi:hypothetical protein